MYLQVQPPIKGEYQGDRVIAKAQATVATPSCQSKTCEAVKAPRNSNGTVTPLLLVRQCVL